MGAGQDYEIDIPWRLPARRNVRPPPQRSSERYVRSNAYRAPPIEQRPPQVGGVKCPNCGGSFPPDMTFCTNCGRYLLV